MELNITHLAELIVENNKCRIWDAIVDRANELFDPELIAQELPTDDEIIDAMTEAARKTIDIDT